MSFKLIQKANRDSELSEKEVVIADIDIPFWSMVKLLISLSIAAIPAFIFLFAFYMAVIYLVSLFGLNS